MLIKSFGSLEDAVAVWDFIQTLIKLELVDELAECTDSRSRSGIQVYWIKLRKLDDIDT